MEKIVSSFFTWAYVFFLYHSYLPLTFILPLMQGVYNDKPATIARFRENYTTKLTQEMRDRLVLENDEMCYNPDDLLPVCEELNIPLVVRPFLHAIMSYR